MVIIVRKCYQKSVDMGLKLEENMYRGVFFFSFPVCTLPALHHFFSQVSPSPGQSQEPTAKGV